MSITIERIYGPKSSGVIRAITKVFRNDAGFNYSGFLISLNKGSYNASQYVCKKRFDFDYNKFRVVTDEYADFDKFPHLRNTKYKAPFGSTVRELFDEIKGNAHVNLMINGHMGNGDELNSLVVHNRLLISRTAPSVRCMEMQSVTGKFPFFVLDNGSGGLKYLDVVDGRAKNVTDFYDGMYTPQLFQDGEDISLATTFAVPNSQPNQLIFDPFTFNAAMSVGGIDNDGNYFFGSFNGLPGQEVTLLEMSKILKRCLSVRHAFLLGCSGDAQMVFRVPDEFKKEFDSAEFKWMAAMPKKGSVSEKMTPVSWDENGMPIGGRKLSNIIIISQK